MESTKWPLYYFVGWPDSQKLQEIDPEAEHTMYAGEGDVFAEKDWVDSLNL